MRFAQRRLLEALARFNDAARQRDLAAVSAQRVCADGEDEVRGTVGTGKEQQEAGGGPNASRRDPRRPVARRHRCESPLRSETGQRTRQRRLESGPCTSSNCTLPR